MCHATIPGFTPLHARWYPNIGPRRPFHEKCKALKILKGETTLSLELVGLPGDFIVDSRHLLDLDK